MPINPDMQGVMGTMQQMQQAQSAQMSLISSSINSLTMTMQQVAQATQMGAATAIQGGSTAIQSLQLGAATAFSDVSAIGSAIGSMMAPPVSAPAVGGPSMAMGGGMRAGGTDFAHGAVMGGISLAGTVASFAAWDVAASAMPGFFATASKGAAAGRAALGGVGLAGAAGAGAGAMAGAAAVVALPLLASLAVEKAVSIGTEHVTAVRDVNAIMNQNASRVMPFSADFDPNMGMPGSRAAAAGIVKDLASNLQIGRQGAAQFMAQGMELGLFTGSGGSAGGIRERAKELADAVSDMTKILGTSMQESLTMMAEVRQMGFDGADAPGVMMTSRGRARMGGFTSAEMHTAGVRGAQMFRGTGVSTTFGFNAAQSDLATVSNLVQTGAISNQLTAAMGGRQAMSETMTANLANYTSNPILLAQMAAGGGGRNLQQVASLAGQNLANMSPMETAAFLGGGLQQQISDMGPEAIRGQQLGALLATTRQQFGAEAFQGMNKTGQINAIAFMATQMGMAQGPDEARALATMSMNPQTFSQQAQAMRAERHREAMEREYSSHGIGGAWRRFSKETAELGSWWGDAINAPVGAVGTVVDNMSNAADRLWHGTRRETLFESNLGGISELAALRSEQARRGNIVTTSGVGDPDLVALLRETGDVTRVGREEAAELGDDYLIVDPRLTAARGREIAMGVFNLGGITPDQLRVSASMAKGDTVEVIAKTVLQKRNSQAAAVHVVLSTRRKLNDIEQKAVDGALDAAYFESGRRIKQDPLARQRITQIFDPDVSIDVRAQRLTELATSGVQRVQQRDEEAYDKIPGNTVQEKSAYVMKSLGAPPSVLARAGKASQTEVDMITPLDRRDAELLEERSTQVAQLVFSRWSSWTTRTADEDFVKAHASDFDNLVAGKLSARETVTLTEELRKAADITPEEAQQRIADLRGKGKLVGQLASSVMASGLIKTGERFTQAVTQGIAGARTNLTRLSGGKLTLAQADILQQVESISGGPADLVRFISDLHDTGDAKTQDTLSQIAQGKGFLGTLTRDVLSGRAKADDPATIRRLYETTGVSGTRDEFTDPAERKRVATMEESAIMFKKTNQTISNLMNTSAALFDAVRELKRRPKVATVGGGS